jgi:hypothetical protein
MPNDALLLAIQVVRLDDEDNVEAGREEVPSDSKAGPLVYRLTDAFRGRARPVFEVGDGAGDVLDGDDHAELVGRVHPDEGRVQFLRGQGNMQNVNWILAGSYPDPAPCLAKI